MHGICGGCGKLFGGGLCYDAEAGRYLCLECKRDRYDVPLRLWATLREIAALTAYDQDGGITGTAVLEDHLRSIEDIAGSAIDELNAYDREARRPLDRP